MRKKILFTLLSTVLIFACNSKTETKQTFDLSAAKKEIDVANRNFEKYISTGDSVGFAKNSYTIDAHYMAPNQPVIVGRKAIQTMCHQTLSAGVSKLD